jgi:hypothetical protein
MRSFLAMAMSSSSALRHRRQHAALRVMLAVMLVHAGIMRRDMQMLAAPLRARIAKPDSIRDACSFCPECVWVLPYAFLMHLSAYNIILSRSVCILKLCILL